MQHSKAIVLVPHVRRGRKFRADNLFIQASIGNKTVEEDDLSPVYAMFIISLVRKKKSLSSLSSRALGAQQLAPRPIIICQ
jgi:hypothetical protein